MRGVFFSLFVLVACNARFTFDRDTPSVGGDASRGGGAGNGGGANALGGVGGAGTAGAAGADPGQLAACATRCAVFDLSCDPGSLDCVECVSDEDCRAADAQRPVCSHAFAPARCVECAYDQDCRSGERCVHEAHRCVPACDEAEDPACAVLAPRPECDVRGWCQGCYDDDECSATPATPYCGPGHVSCAQCAADRHCANRPDAKRCDPVLARCVACRDSGDCPAGLTCDRWLRKCRE